LPPFSWTWNWQGGWSDYQVIGWRCSERFEFFNFSELSARIYTPWEMQKAA